MFSDNLEVKKKLQQRGMFFTSFCCMCRGCDDAHLFFGCPFAKAVWNWLLGKFHVSIGLQGDFTDFFKHVMSLGMSPQVRIMGCCCCCYYLGYLEPNGMDASLMIKRAPSFSRLCFGIVGWVKEASLIAKVPCLILCKTFKLLFFLLLNVGLGGPLRLLKSGSFLLYMVG